MRNGYITQVLTYVDIQEIVKIEGKVIQIYEGVIYRENFSVNPFEKLIENFLLSDKNLKLKDQIIDVMQLLVKLLRMLYTVNFFGEIF